MQSADGQSWFISRDLPENVNYVCWVRQHAAELTPFPDSPWEDWLARVVALKPVIDSEIIALIEHPDLKMIATREWPRFSRAWKQTKRQLVQRLTQSHGQETPHRLNALMTGSTAQLVFLQTPYPGEFCRQYGNTWVLGDAYFEQSAFLELLSRRTDEDSDL